MTAADYERGMARRIAVETAPQVLSCVDYVDKLYRTLHDMGVGAAMEKAKVAKDARLSEKVLEAYGLRERLDEHNKFFSVMHAERIADLERRLAELEGVKEPQR